MLAKVLSGTTIGLDGVLIEVEVDVAGRGFPSFNIVGLPNKAIEEAKDRVRTAILNTGFEMPDSRLTVNLAPADIPKEGSAYDLPIAVGILAASGMIQRTALPSSLFIGEVSLEGKLRKVPGVLSIVIMAKEIGLKSIYVPIENAKEAALVEDITIYPVPTLADLVLHLNHQQELAIYSPTEKEADEDNFFEGANFAEIKGQSTAKRALEVAASGFHNIHLRGCPGAGKTLLSRSFPGILPPLEKKEALEVTKIYSVTGLLNGKSFMRQRPFRAPHHTTSRIGLIGGGTIPQPGEISLAHRGVLFLDELPEFPRSVLEALRQPLEDGIVAISRASGRLIFPAKFLLLAASNPCPCGYLGHPTKTCTCSSTAILKYKKRLSGPLLDRIDLHLFVSPVEESKLTQTALSESSETIRERVRQAQERQHQRLKNEVMKTNGEMGLAEIRKYCKLTVEAEDLLKQALLRLSLSARSYYKVIKVSQTIADLAGADTIEKKFIAEALQYRVTEE